MEHIGKNIAEVKERIAIAAAKSGRNVDDITLVAVTKTIEPESIREAICHGLTDLGENRVQEMAGKFDLISGAKWHMIGHLQRNKVKQAIEMSSLIHSLDSVRLAEEIQKAAEKMGIIADVLIEINIANEDTKHGIKPEDAADFAANLEKYGNIRLNGLMCVAPFVDFAEENRKFFQQMRDIYIDIKDKHMYNANMNILSMGMSNDYEIAIEQGANLVRIGTRIFGSR